MTTDVPSMAGEKLSLLTAIMTASLWRNKCQGRMNLIRVIIINCNVNRLLILPIICGNLWNICGFITLTQSICCCWLHSPECFVYKWILCHVCAMSFCINRCMLYRVWSELVCECLYYQCCTSLYHVNEIN